MRPAGVPIARLMLVVAIIGLDCAALRAVLPRIPNPGLTVMTAGLQVLLLHSKIGRGPRRACWLGFQATGWACIFTGLAASRRLWSFHRSFFEAHVLGRPITGPGAMAYLLFSALIELIVVLAAAAVGGLPVELSSVLRGRGEPPRPGDERSGLLSVGNGSGSGGSRMPRAARRPGTTPPRAALPWCRGRESGRFWGMARPGLRPTSERVG